jgi:protein translocase SecG subunit
MLRIINVSEIIVAVLLTVSILLQNRGAGLSQAFGGDFGGYYTKRGFEKFLVYFSIALSVLFIVLAISSLILISQKTTNIISN